MAVDKIVRTFAMLHDSLGEVWEAPGEQLAEREEIWDVRRQPRQPAAHLATLSLHAVSRR
jgi:ABC-type cobalamin transport system permease subunit